MTRHHQVMRDRPLRAEHERRLEAMAEFIAAYEAAHGEITTEEMAAAEKRARARAIVVNG